MKTFYIILLQLLLAYSAYSKNTYTFLLNDKGCPTCRLEFIVDITDQLLRDYPSDEIKIIIDSEDKELSKSMANAFNKKVSVFTEKDAKIITKYYLSEPVNDVVIAVEDGNGNIIFINNVNSKYNETGKVVKAINEATKNKLNVEITEIDPEKDPAKINIVSSLDKDKIFILNTSNDMFIADKKNKTFQEINIPDQIYYKYCDKNNEIVKTYANSGDKPIKILSPMFIDNNIVNLNIWLLYDFCNQPKKSLDPTTNDSILIDSYRYKVKSTILKYDIEKNAFILDSSLVFPRPDYAVDLHCRSGNYIFSYFNEHLPISDYRDPVCLGSIIDSNFKEINRFTSNNIKRFLKTDSLPLSISQYDYNKKNDKSVFLNEAMKLFLIKGNDATTKVNHSGILSWKNINGNEKDLLYAMREIDYGNVSHLQMFAEDNFIAVFMLSEIENKTNAYLQIYDYDGKMQKQFKIDLPNLLADNIRSYDTAEETIYIYFIKK